MEVMSLATTARASSAWRRYRGSAASVTRIPRPTAAGWNTSRRFRRERGKCDPERLTRHETTLGLRTREHRRLARRLGAHDRQNRRRMPDDRSERGGANNRRRTAVTPPERKDLL